MYSEDLLDLACIVSDFEMDCDQHIEAEQTNPGDLYRERECLIPLSIVLSSCYYSGNITILLTRPLPFAPT